MYEKKSHGWYKHKDFILLDLICLFLAFLLAHFIRVQLHQPYRQWDLSQCFVIYSMCRSDRAHAVRKLYRRSQKRILP